MDEKQRLLEALKQDNVKSWVAAALSAIDDETLVFVGNSGKSATNTAEDLLRIYRIRQTQCREQRIEVAGLAELIESLEAVDQASVIAVDPFLGTTSSVTAFWNRAGDLMGCVTVLGRDPEKGQRTLDFARGKRP